MGIVCGTKIVLLLIVLTPFSAILIRGWKLTDLLGKRILNISLERTVLFSTIVSVVSFGLIRSKSLLIAESYALVLTYALFSIASIFAYSGYFCIFLYKLNYGTFATMQSGIVRKSCKTETIIVTSYHDQEISYTNSQQEPSLLQDDSERIICHRLAIWYAVLSVLGYVIKMLSL